MRRLLSRQRGRHAHTSSIPLLCCCAAAHEGSVVCRVALPPSAPALVRPPPYPPMRRPAPMEHMGSMWAVVRWWLIRARQQRSGRGHCSRLRLYSIFTLTREDGSCACVTVSKVGGQRVGAMISYKPCFSRHLVLVKTQTGTVYTHQEFKTRSLTPIPFCFSCLCMIPQVTNLILDPPPLKD